MSGLRKLILMMTLIGVMAGRAHAFFVEDPTSWAKTTMVYNKAVEQLAQLRQQYSQLINMRNLAQKQVSNITGLYHMGDLMNSARDLQHWQWSASNWEDTLKGIAGGNDHRFKELRDAYIKAHNVVSTGDYGQSHTKENAATYKNDVDTNRAVAASAQDEYNRINDYLSKLHEIGQQIESTDNKNTKAAIDLNSRIVQQLGYIMLESVRMQTVLINLETQMQASTISGQSQQSQFLQHSKE